MSASPLLPGQFHAEHGQRCFEKDSRFAHLTGLLCHQGFDRILSSPRCTCRCDFSQSNSKGVVLGPASPSAAPCRLSCRRAVFNAFPARKLSFSTFTCLSAGLATAAPLRVLQRCNAGLHSVFKGIPHVRPKSSTADFTHRSIDSRCCTPAVTSASAIGTGRPVNTCARPKLGLKSCHH